ncbi:hypothetical protein Pth03_67800 [Planotetraspora thailandica]|uniref:Uncharacterized protein n=1 Tax=Planotetraspora thailandica TaxID=487172 RepID=A0A8J3Y072_9ACTN|nr:hypothetical protein Pth03_67800 [Planotetraspora thailandica]
MGSARDEQHVVAALVEPPADGSTDRAGADDDIPHRSILARPPALGFSGPSQRICCVRYLFPALSGGRAEMYKEFLGEVVVWLIPVVVLIGLAYLITRPA